MRQQLKLRLDGKTVEVPKGTRFLELAKQFSSGYTSPILLVTLNGILHELGATVEEEGELRFLTIRDKAGYQSYERSAILLLLAAYHKLYGERSAAVWIDYKESGALRCRIAGRQTVTETELACLEAEMRVLAAAAHPIEKRSVPTREAVRLFAARGMQDKAELLRFRIYSSVNLYRLGEYEDYFYGYMLPDS